jgi:hypothetical protein
VDKIIEFFALAGMSTIFITPLTLTIGVINAIRKPEKEAMPYTVMAIISAYLIIMPLMYVVLRT